MIYGDTDSTFVSLNGAFTPEEADKVGNDLVTSINQWWTEHLEQEYQLTSILELEYETHYQRFLMPTIRAQRLARRSDMRALSVKVATKGLFSKGLKVPEPTGQPYRKSSSRHST
ncbi:DNA polymerase II [Vibrio maritimus]|uniref:DNA polymerase II n=1 Tax=Vibrio maritimus TaxID=990268 RepID=A0A090S767_9VIBR|nr:DNA polymerase II [Vibrio maritimus]